MFLHEHTHSMVLDFSLLFIGMCFGMFLGYLFGVFSADARRKKATVLPWIRTED